MTKRWFKVILVSTFRDLQKFYTFAQISSWLCTKKCFEVIYTEFEYFREFYLLLIHYRDTQAQNLHVELESYVAVSNSGCQPNTHSIAIKNVIYRE